MRLPSFQFVKIGVGFRDCHYECQLQESRPLCGERNCVPGTGCTGDFIAGNYFQRDRQFRRDRHLRIDGDPEDWGSRGNYFDRHAPGLAKSWMWRSNPRVRMQELGTRGGHDA